MYTEAYIKEKVYVSLRKKIFRAKKEHEARRNKSRKDKGDVVDAPEPQAKKAKAMTAAQRKVEGKRLAALANEALAKRMLRAEFAAMFGDKQEEVQRREESAGVGTTPARATSLPLSYEPYPIDTNVPNRHVRTRMIRSYPHGTIVPYGYVRTVGVRPYSNGTIVLV